MVGHHLFDLLARYGTPVLFLGQMPRDLWPAVPDELLLTIAGALVRRGDLRGPTTVAAAIAGSLTGITLSCVFLFGILVPAKYWFGDDTLQSHEDWVVASVVAVAVGVVVTIAYWVNVRRLKKG